jgi:hypothetical protein
MTRSTAIRPARAVPALVALLVLVALAAAGGAQARARLVGPATLKVQTNVTYRADGLVSGRYHLMVRKRLTHAGRSYRCVAYIAAPRQASGSEAFKGTLPSALYCTPVSGKAPTWNPRPPAGTYEAVACVAPAGAPSGVPAYNCDPGHSVAARTVRVQR